jgi:hypothetical protein
MNEKRINKSYSKEFKEEAVALITEQSYSVAQAASASRDSNEPTVLLETRTRGIKSSHYAECR